MNIFVLQLIFMKIHPVQILFLVLLVSIRIAWAQELRPEQIIQERIYGEIPDRLNASGKILFSKIEMPKFYANRNFELAWGDPKNRSDLMESIASAFDEGLDPADYHQERISGLLKLADQRGLSNTEKADLDMLMTDALIMYAAHLLGGKLEQSELRKEWDVEKNARPANVDSLLTVNLHNHRIKSALEALKPSHYVYSLMKLHLKRLREIAAAGGWPQVSRGEESLKKGMKDARVAEVRAYLRSTGDLTLEATVAEDYFDEVLEQAVKRFQTRHNLTVDGVVGKGSVEQMNVTVEQRIETIRLNLERLRWIFHHPDEDFLMVNIAGFWVKRFQNRKEVFHSRVIVGTHLRESPIFKGVMRYVVVNPTWTLPYSIATHETLPLLQKDPGYLQAKHMEITDGSGKIIDPNAIDFSQYSMGNFPYIIRQRPGPWNSLGRIKFMFPNKYSVYLHDTPSRGLFERADRAFSHGCIRTDDVWGLFMNLMNDPDNWNMERIQQLLDSGETTTIDLPKPINIYLIYLTSTVDENNRLYFMKDVYKRDAAVSRALNKPAAY